MAGRAGAFLAFVSLVLSSWAVTAASSDPLLDEKGGVTVDWRHGTIVATAGAAADHRMPSADVARAGAERRARAAALARIVDALRVLPLGASRHLDDAAVERAASRARSTNVEYQSNGGVQVRMEVGFGDWVDGEPQPSPPGAGGSVGSRENKPADGASFVLSEGHLAAAPVLTVGGQEVILRSARYAPASAIPVGARPLPVRIDKQGRLMPDKDVSASEFAGRNVVIYVRKILR